MLDSVIHNLDTSTSSLQNGENRIDSSHECGGKTNTVVSVKHSDITLTELSCGKSKILQSKKGLGSIY